MKKVVIHRPGGYERLEIETTEDPQPGPGEVLVKTLGIGVNYADCVIRWGLYESAKKYVGWPITPGFEFSGVIEAIGEGSHSWKVGDKVFGLSRFGAYSSHVVVPAQQIYPLPSSLSVEEAAGFPAVFLTAYHGLFQNIIVRPKMKILVHSAAGGVGGALVQLGRVAQCFVVGVVGSSHKVESTLENGANHVIDKSKENLWEQARYFVPEGYDLIFDANGVSTLADSYKHLRPTGKLVCYGFHSMFPKQGGKVQYLRLLTQYLRTPRFNPLKMTSDNKSLITFNLSFLFDRTDLLDEGMNHMLALLKEGKIRGPKVTCFPLEKVGKAHESLESGKTVGKLVLIP